MVDFTKIRAIDFHTHAEEPCGCHADDGYDDLQTSARLAVFMSFLKLC